MKAHRSAASFVDPQILRAAINEAERQASAQADDIAARNSNEMMVAMIQCERRT